MLYQLSYVRAAGASLAACRRTPRASAARLKLTDASDAGLRKDRRPIIHNACSADALAELGRPLQDGVCTRVSARGAKGVGQVASDFNRLAPLAALRERRDSTLVSGLGSVDVADRNLSGSQRVIRVRCVEDVRGE